MPPITPLRKQPSRRLDKQKTPDYDVFPQFQEFEKALVERRREAIRDVLQMVDEDYLPGLRKRLTNWLHTTIDLQYDEDMQAGCFKEQSLRNEVIEHISKTVTQWFQSYGYKLAVIYVSANRFLLRIKAREFEGDLPHVPDLERRLKPEKIHSYPPPPPTIHDDSELSSMVDLGEYEESTTERNPLLVRTMKSPAMHRMRWICPF